MLNLALKLLSVPIFIGAVSLVARRWGPVIGGLILGLPLTSGPVILFLALEQGYSFASLAAQGTLLGLISLSISCFVYSLISSRSGWPISLAGCCLSYFVISALLDLISVPLIYTYVVVFLFLVLLHYMFPSGTLETVTRDPPRWEIPARMIAATSVVLLITGVAAVLGPRLSGLFTPFPVYACIIAVFLHSSEGARVSTLFLRGAMLGTLTTATFLFVIAFFILSLGLLETVTLALLVGFCLHLFLFCSIRRELS